ncbi:hypothetical protein HZ326_7239 [Fusarium oxysporum f. sp. albedinis]|nr:hypothetical protein HZ326_7239 [Fusarium oxysporum f. sp. albedinis]
MQDCTDNGVIPPSETSTNLTLMHSVNLEYTHNNRIKGLPVVSDDDLNSGRVKYPRTTLIGPGGRLYTLKFGVFIHRLVILQHHLAAASRGRLPNTSSIFSDRSEPTRNRTRGTM